jgi:hypothetical protein
MPHSNDVRAFDIGDRGIRILSHPKPARAKPRAKARSSR